MTTVLKSAIELTQKMVRFPSVSHQSNEDVSRFVADELEKRGFDVEWLSYLDDHGVRKVSLVGKRGVGVGGVAYLAHTDVVPAEDWSVNFCGAFDPVEKDGRLYGRGTCDMKGSLASALIAASMVPSMERNPLYFVVTSDEEVGMLGAKKVNEQSHYFREMVENKTVGIVGEPTQLSVVHAHKGGLRFHVSAKGISAHTSTTEGMNANYSLIPALADILSLRNDSEANPCYQNQMFDPPTLSWNMTITNEPEAVNVTPSLAQLNNFLRTMPGIDVEPLLAEVETICRKFRLDFHRKESVAPWSVAPHSPWIQNMLQIVGQEKSCSVCYATDAAVLQRLSAMMICGPGDIQQAHRSDEWISLEQLSRGVEVYRAAFSHSFDR